MPAIYVHVPFCKQKCKYCDFNSYAGLSSLHDAYFSALKTEIAFHVSRLDDLRVDSIYIGGGTPTLVDPGHINEILKSIDQYFSISTGAEISIEANPETVSQDNMIAFREAGVNRLSIGFQSLDDGCLKVLGRKHSAQQAIDAFRMGRAAGFDNINIDLIFGTPGQTLADWAITLEQVVSLDPEHLSCYCLTIEPGTPIEREVLSKIVTIPDDDLQSDMFVYAIESLMESGYKQYEISNFAKQGKRCRHNLVYWDNHDYLGIGAGAHSKIKRKRFSNASVVENYIRAYNESSYIVSPQDLSVEDEISETVFLGFRKIDGIDLEEFKARFGTSLLDIYGDRIDKLTDAGLIEQKDNAIKLTSRGILLGNEVFSKFV